MDKIKNVSRRFFSTLYRFFFRPIKFPSFKSWTIPNVGMFLFIFSALINPSEIITPICFSVMGLIYCYSKYTEQKSRDNNIKASLEEINARIDQVDSNATFAREEASKAWNSPKMAFFIT